MRCPKCGRDNPANVAFCVFCGQRLEQAPTPSPAAPQAPTVETPTLRPSEAAKAPPAYQPAYASATPAFRPFGLVLIAVYQFLQASFWILIGQNLYQAQITTLITSIGISTLPGLLGLPSEGLPSEVVGGAMRMIGLLVGAREVPAMLLLILLTLLVLLTGFLTLTGAIGLWLMAGWGRRITIWVQAPVMVLNLSMLLLLLFKGEFIRQAGLLLPSLTWPAMGIVIPILIVSYLLRPDLDHWFREG